MANGYRMDFGTTNVIDPTRGAREALSNVSDMVNRNNLLKMRQEEALRNQANKERDFLMRQQAAKDAALRHDYDMQIKSAQMEAQADRDELLRDKAYQDMTRQAQQDYSAGVLARIAAEPTIKGRRDLFDKIQKEEGGFLAGPNTAKTIKDLFTKPAPTVSEQISMAKLQRDILGDANTMSGYRTTYPNMPDSITTPSAAKVWVDSQKNISKGKGKFNFSKELYKNLTGKDSGDVAAIDEFLVKHKDSMILLTI